MRIFIIVLCLPLTWGFAQKKENKFPMYKDVSSLNKDLQKHHYQAVDGLPLTFQRLVSLHKAFDPGDYSDWYALKKEKGQTFSQYQKKARKNGAAKKVIYIQLIGGFSDKQRQVTKLMARYIRAYFQLPVKFTKPLPLRVIPKTARRVHPDWGDKQIYTKYILYNVLLPKRPKNAAAYIALTAQDLYPDPDWNFVYGQASLTKKVGVFSMYRNGDPEESKEEFQQCLLRTVKTAVHEIGHMLKIRHCVAFECGMNGSNNRGESDRRPSWLCPVCLCKLHWYASFKLKKRYLELAQVCEDAEIEEAKFFRRSVEELQKTNN